MSTVNRYFKPAVYTPINTHVPFPFEEMLKIGAIKQGRIDDQKKLEQSQLVNGDYKNRVDLATGMQIPVQDATVGKQIESQLNNQINGIVSSVVGSTDRSSPMYAAAWNEAVKYSNGARQRLGKMAETSKDIDKLYENRAKSKSSNYWDFYDADKQLFDYAQGKTGEINPNTIIPEVAVDPIAEVNAMMDGIQETFKTRPHAGRDGKGGIVSGQIKGVSVQEAMDVFNAGLSESKLGKDIDRQFRYNMEILVPSGAMTEDQAKAIKQTRIDAAGAVARKRVSDSGSASYSDDARHWAEEERKNQIALNKRMTDFNAVPTKTKTANSSISTIGDAIQVASMNFVVGGQKFGFTENGNISPVVKQTVANKLASGEWTEDTPEVKALRLAENVVTAARSMIADPSENKEMTDIQVMKAYQAGLKNTQETGIGYKRLEPNIRDFLKKDMLDDIKNRSAVVLTDGNAVSAKSNLAQIIVDMGYEEKEVGAVLNNISLAGIVKTDIFGTGAGSFIIEIPDKNNTGSRVQVQVQATSTQEAIFGKSSYLAGVESTGETARYYGEHLEIQNGKGGIPREESSNGTPLTVEDMQESRATGKPIIKDGVVINSYWMASPVLEVQKKGGEVDPTSSKMSSSSRQYVWDVASGSYKAQTQAYTGKIDMPTEEVFNRDMNNYTEKNPLFDATRTDYYGKEVKK